MLDDTSIWAALADSKRRQIITLLEEKPRTTSTLSEFFDVSRFAVMKHLKVLEQANLIKVKREGRQRWNILNDELAHFLRTKLGDDNGSKQLVDLLDLRPGSHPDSSLANATANTIHIEQSVRLQAAPAQVFAAFTVGIDSWWSRRVATDSQVYLEPYVNGRFYEAFNTAGQGSLYGTVTYIKQDEELRLSGTRELAEQVANVHAADNFVHVTLETKDNTTQFTLDHYITGGLDEPTRETCISRWHSLLNQHFKPFVEKGIPTTTIPDSSDR